MGVSDTNDGKTQKILYPFGFVLWLLKNLNEEMQTILRRQRNFKISVCEKNSKAFNSQNCQQLEPMFSSLSGWVGSKQLCTFFLLLQEVSVTLQLWNFDNLRV